MDGILLFNKPILWTSHDAVDFLRKKTGQRSIGHAGTLDPMATGLLVMLVGKATKLSSALSSLDKDYQGVLTLGISTDTQDLEGKVLSQKNAQGCGEAEVGEVFLKLTGKQMQVPPAYSAVRQKGKKLYELARRGVFVQPEPREVTITEFRLTRFESPDAHFFMTCSKGAYVRALCHEAGERLGCGGALSALVRTRIGPFRLAQALTREQAERLPNDILSKLLLSFDASKNDYLSRN